MTIRRRPGTTMLEDPPPTCRPRPRSATYRMVRSAILTTVAFFVGLPVVLVGGAALFSAIAPAPTARPAASHERVIEEHYTAPAAAKPSSSGRTILMSQGGDQILIWRDKDALANGMALIGAGAHLKHPEVVTVLLACITPNGTEVGNTDFNWGGTNDVTVLTGTAVGCRGTVLREQLLPLD